MAGNDSNPADEVDFSTYGQALPWFQNQSREARIALTVRSAFRVLPSVETDQVTADLMPHVTLSAFRACFVACTIVEYPLQRDRLRSNAAQATRAGPIGEASKCDRYRVVFP